MMPLDLQIKFNENCKKEESEFIHEKIIEYGRKFGIPEKIEKHFLLKDKDDKIIGGTNFCISYGTAYISDLWIDENFRNINLATKLMNKIEKFSKENGANYVALETMEFEAPKFYEKMGYKVEHTREGILGKYTQYSFIKKL
jgi:ribosomal protein S18 acetylase RimI-like enzyme